MLSEPVIKEIRKTRLIGLSKPMSIIQNQTHHLWREFGPLKHKISGIQGTELYSIEQFPKDYFQGFDTNKTFTKWAAVAVDDHAEIPEGLQTLSVEAGLYAVFIYTGSSQDGASAYQYIYGEWIPKSSYEIDHRPHLAIMGDKYKNNDPSSEEEIWIPVRKKL